MNFHDDDAALPDTVDALIDMLDHQSFPLKNLPANTDHGHMQRHFGTRDVVDFLRSLQRDRDERAKGIVE